MVVKKKAVSSKGKAVSSKTKTKAKAKPQQDIFLYVSKNDKYEDGGNLPFMRGFVSIPADLVDAIQAMGFYDEQRDAYQLDVALWKKGGGVLSGSIKQSWKVDKENEEDDLDLELGDDDEDGEEEEDSDEDEEDDTEDDIEDEEDDEPAPVQSRNRVRLDATATKPKATSKRR